jgi:hypothetical protein
MIDERSPKITRIWIIMEIKKKGRPSGRWYEGDETEMKTSASWALNN